jgi:hypothetical protein
MATDITRLLIQMIRAGEQPDGLVGALAANNTVLENSSAQNGVVSSAADFAQLLSTAGPLVTALNQSLANAATAILGSTVQTASAQAANLSSNAAAAGGAAAAGAAGAGAASIALPALGAAAILVLSFVLAELGSDGPSSQAQFYQDLESKLEALQDTTVKSYWDDNFNALGAVWLPVEGYLNDLSLGGTNSSDVKSDVSGWHTDAMTFVDALYSGIENPLAQYVYWEVPAPPAGDVPQSPSVQPSVGFNWATGSWYGQFPVLATSGNMPDPTTFLGMFALGLQSYLMLECLRNIVDSSQMTFSESMKTYGPLIGQWNEFLYTNYASAVNGILKTDLPTEYEILGYLWYLANVIGSAYAVPSTNPGQNPMQSWGAPWPTPDDNVQANYSGDGWAWTGVYGASEVYPYSAYYGSAQLDPTDTYVFTPAYIIPWIVAGNNAATMLSQWSDADILFNVGSDETLVSMDSLASWVIPWLQNKLILGRMACWKAIYLFNNFGFTWSVLQSVQRLVPDPPVVPPTVTLAELGNFIGGGFGPSDNMIASGNWSVRELCNTVVANGDLLTGNDYVSSDNGFVYNWAPISSTVWTRVSGQSVGGFVEFLYNVANGNWAGPPEALTRPVSPRPLSLRGLLAAAATP